VNDDNSSLEHAIWRLTGCSSKYVETISVTECFHGFRGEVLWRREVAVYELKSHPTANRAYAWVNKDPGCEPGTQVIVLAIPPVNSARTAVAAAMAASIVNGNFEVS
jgi:hypothetical protein